MSCFHSLECSTLACGYTKIHDYYLHARIICDLNSTKPFVVEVCYLIPAPTILQKMTFSSIFNVIFCPQHRHNIYTYPLPRCQTKHCWHSKLPTLECIGCGVERLCIAGKPFSSALHQARLSRQLRFLLGKFWKRRRFCFLVANCEYCVL